jgi:hypothetical protein
LQRLDEAGEVLAVALLDLDAVFERGEPVGATTVVGGLAVLGGVALVQTS